MFRSKISGVALLIICVIIVAMASFGATPADRDITPVLLLAPLGVYITIAGDRDNTDKEDI
jgi:hypothetical protein